MLLSKVEDKQLVREYLDGKERAFEVLISRYKDRVFGYVYKMVKDEDLTNDIFQDTFIKVINTLKKGKYNEEGKFLPWVMRIAHNLVIDHFRKSAKMPIAGRGNGNEDDEFDIFNVLRLEDCTVEDDLIEEQIHDDVRALVELLPDDQKQVVKMRHYMGMSFKDIAESTDVSINTALGRMRYALINLRKLIEEKDIMLTLH
jgi:RNA polymerase sigma-70 factor (ECF subfamily)